MKMKKILAALLATAVATTLAVSSVFAATIALDPAVPDNVSGWGAVSTAIPKQDLVDLGGNAKIVLDIETAGLLPDQYLLRPTTVGDSWIHVATLGTDAITSDTACAKPDNFIPIKEGATTLEFVLSADAIAQLSDNGLSFQYHNVWVKSATIEKVDALQMTMTLIEDEMVSDPEGYCFGDFNPVAAPAAEEAPATEEAPAATENTETGNAPIAGMVAIMALAGVAMVASKAKK